jgi:hypothetical protein
MKLKIKAQSYNTIMALGMCGSLLTEPTLASPKTFKKHSTLSLDPSTEAPNKRKKEKVKASASRNNSTVKIYPDAFKKSMHVVAKYNDGKEIDFFVFDLQGTLMRNFRMKAKDQNIISGLDRGTYIYRVFCGDEESTSGQFEIR